MVEEKKVALPSEKLQGDKKVGGTSVPKKAVRRKPSSIKSKAKKSAKEKGAVTVTEEKKELKAEKKVDTDVRTAKNTDRPLTEIHPQQLPRQHERRKSFTSVEVKPTTKYIYGLKGKRPIVGLTAYDAIMSKLVAKAGVDFILVGDSVGTTLLGYETTIPVTIDDMVHHTAAVKRGLPECLVVADLPFGEASFSFDRLLDSARRLMQCGADAVKIEGGKDVADDIEKLVATGIPVMGHIGLLPQTVKAIGGYRKFGSDRVEADSIYTDAICLEEAGCFAIIAEMVEGELAAELTNQILPPLVGIGSGEQCDGQILVTHDLLGLTPSPLPSFVKPCATLGLDGLNALQGYVQKIRSAKLKR
jgi:3-methyl-2-oxobutanoate hydroxymethyltransferase